LLEPADVTDTDTVYLYVQTCSKVALHGAYPATLIYPGCNSKNIMKITSQSLHTPKMSSDAKRLVQAAVAYAEQKKDTCVHHLPFAEFLTLATLPEETTLAQVISVLSETRRATASIRIVDQSSRGKKQLLSGSWPVFLSVFVTDSHVSFEVCPRMWEPVSAGSSVPDDE
jgi:hypothetical protein